MDWRSFDVKPENLYSQDSHTVRLHPYHQIVRKRSHELSLQRSHLMIRILSVALFTLSLFIIYSCTKQTETQTTFTGAKGEVKLMTLDPGHFHAALVQKTMYDQVSPIVHVYAPEGSDLREHLKRINGFNTRAENPTNWGERIYTGRDYLQKMITEKPGNVMITAGNNQKKTEYLKAAVEAGINVLSDKPMCIDGAGFELLKATFESAKNNQVLLYDIMTERHEITTILQKELANNREVFGELQIGNPEDPAVTKESVHHFFKYVAGSPLKRPAWYYDVTQQGEGIVDVNTHLVDLVQWECFPEQIIDYSKDINLLNAKHWPTMVTREQFEKSTGLADFPDYLKNIVNADGVLAVYCNGEIVYTIKGIHAKVSVVWNYQAPEGTGDTHFSVMKGTKANVIIRQGKEQNFRPELYVDAVAGVELLALETALQDAIVNLQQKYTGVELKREGNAWHILIPDKYRVGHEAHFGQVTEKYLHYLIEGKLPDWEAPNMLAKYYTTTKALELARQ